MRRVQRPRAIPAVRRARAVRPLAAGWLPSPTCPSERTCLWEHREDCRRSWNRSWNFQRQASSILEASPSCKARDCAARPERRAWRRKPSSLSANPGLSHGARADDDDRRREAPRGPPARARGSRHRPAPPSSRTPTHPSPYPGVFGGPWDCRRSVHPRRLRPDTPARSDNSHRKRRSSADRYSARHTPDRTASAPAHTSSCTTRRNTPEVWRRWNRSSRSGLGWTPYRRTPRRIRRAAPDTSKPPHTTQRCRFPRHHR